MNFIKKNIEKAYNFLLSQSFRVKSERAILAVAISSYIAHLILILLVNQEIIKLESNFFTSPIAAIYTPFSFILIYEVYLLIFFLPKSISFYIGKQYEIIMLIVIRKIFKDISNIKMSSDWFFIKSDLQFTYDVVTSLIVFFLIFLFYKNIINKNDSISEANSIKLKSIKKFISFKKTLAVLLVPALFILSLYTFINWVVLSFEDYKYGILEFKNINRIFFEEFFTVLIIVDVLLLLFSLYYSDKFYKIIRNSGFVISTILIKTSFSAEGIVSNILVVGSVLFGLLILLIHNFYEKNKAYFSRNY